jgi:sulfoxide reductase heme-binding subunit YedZ
MIGLTQSLALWYFTRGSGAMSLVLLTLSFVSGTPTLLSWGSERLPRLVVQMLHRSISLLVLVFIGLHVATTVIDGFAPIGWMDAVVPFRAGYRPIWLGLGAVAVDLLLAIVLTSLLRVRIGYRAWQKVHMLTYAMWPIALVHALGTGSDTRSRWMWVVDGICATAVMLSIIWRLKERLPAGEVTRRIVIGLLATVPVLLIAWTVAGPLQPGWGKVHHSAAHATLDTEVLGG